jgi:hypothetical protein
VTISQGSGPASTPSGSPPRRHFTPIQIWSGLVWGWYEWRRARVRRAQPNPGHLAVAAIEAMVPGSVVITLNVDDLH